MKLYYAPGTCSLASHIVLREIGLDFELIRVDNSTKRTEVGESYLEINPKGYVASLLLDDGQIITEGPAILQYLGDLAPERGLVPTAGTMNRTRLHEWLNFVTAELHAGCVPLFRSDLPQRVTRIFQERLGARLSFVDEHLKYNTYLVDAMFGVADAYLFTVVTWLPRLQVDIEKFGALLNFMMRVKQRQSVVAACAAEHISLTD